MCPSKAYVV